MTAARPPADPRLPAGFRRGAPSSSSTSVSTSSHQVEGAVHDDRRVAFLPARPRAAHQVLSAGACVEGHDHRSLLDDFERVRGHRPCSGLLHVDRAARRRTVKDSGHRYARGRGRRGHPHPPRRPRPGGGHATDISRVSRAACPAVFPISRRAPRGGRGEAAG